MGLPDGYGDWAPAGGARLQWIPARVARGVLSNTRVKRFPLPPFCSPAGRALFRGGIVTPPTIFSGGGADECRPLDTVARGLVRLYEGVLFAGRVASRPRSPNNCRPLDSAICRPLLRRAKSTKPEGGSISRPYNDPFARWAFFAYGESSGESHYLQRRDYRKHHYGIGGIIFLSSGLVNFGNILILDI